MTDTAAPIKDVNSTFNSLTCAAVLQCALLMVNCICAGPSEAQSLGDSLDTIGWTWQTGSDCFNMDWQGQSSVTHDGIDAARVLISVQFNSCNAWLTTSLTGPGWLSFYYHATPMQWGDTLTLQVDSQSTLLVDGTHNWCYTNIFIAAGTHQLRWNYFVSWSPSGIDHGEALLDEVAWVPGLPEPPAFSTNGDTLAIDHSGFGFDYAAPSGATVRVQASSDLYVWQTLHTNVAGTNVSHYSDVDSVSLSNRAYRLLLVY